ncbi:MAG: hypothetical protein AAGD38_11570 [Acidobacteriota bacterium]
MRFAQDLVRHPWPLFLVLLMVSGPISVAEAWTPEGQTMIGREAARLAPPDLYRQLRRNRESYDIGLTQPFSMNASSRVKYADGRGSLDETILTAVRTAILAIEQHRPFNEIAYRMGVVAHLVAAANNPLATGSGDPNERRYAADFARYFDTAEPRMRRVFYGFRPIQSSGELDAVVREAMARSRSLYATIGSEYSRIGFASGVSQFDDRSTAYGIAALSLGHAISDIAEVLRYIWLSAGGIDTRKRLPLRGLHVIHLPRGATSDEAGTTRTIRLRQP